MGTYKKQEVIDSIGIPYEDGTVPIFYVKTQDEVDRISAAMKDVGSYGYYVTEELRNDRKRFTIDYFMNPPVIYENKPDDANTKPQTNSKKAGTSIVYMYDKKDHAKLLDTFESVSIAAGKVAPDKVASAKTSINNCINGKSASALGYYWEKK